jgi:hypothetical protein
MLDLRDIDSKEVYMICFLVLGIRDDGQSREMQRSMRCLFSCCMLSVPSPCLFSSNLWPLFELQIALLLGSSVLGLIYLTQRCIENKCLMD